MTLSTSAVAVCCCSASLNSLASLAGSSLALAREKPRRRATFVERLDTLLTLSRPAGLLLLERCFLLDEPPRAGCLIAAPTVASDGNIIGFADPRRLRRTVAFCVGQTRMARRLPGCLKRHSAGNSAGLPWVAIRGGPHLTSASPPESGHDRSRSPGLLRAIRQHALVDPRVRKVSPGVQTERSRLARAVHLVGWHF